MAAVVEIQGLGRLRRELRKASVELPKETKARNREVADDIARRSQDRARSLGSVHGHVASGIRARATMGEARIELNATRDPAIFGAEFGGGARPRTRQFPPWRGSGRNAGYMVYPTIWDRAHDIMRFYTKMVDDLITRGDIRA